MTASKSSSVILTRVRSRTMPALLTRMSRRPKVSTAVCDDPPGGLEVGDRLVGRARPARRAASISAQTAAAGSSSEASPRRPTPRSLTTTAAPWRASSRANSRPMPRPAPVTMATRSSSSMRTSPRRFGSGRAPSSAPGISILRHTVGPAIGAAHCWLSSQLLGQKDGAAMSSARGTDPFAESRGPERPAPAGPGGGAAGPWHPLARDADADRGALDQDAIRALAEADLFRVTIGEQWGGLGLGDVEAAIVLEEIARHDVSTAICCQLAFNGPSRGHRAPRRGRPEGPVAARGGRRRGHREHRHHRARRRFGRPEHAQRAGGGRARPLAAQRVQELLDARRRGQRHPGLVPLAGRRRGEGHRRGGRPHGPRRGGDHRPPPRHGDPRRHRGRGGLRRRGDRRGGRPGGRGPVDHRGLQGAPRPPQPRAVRQRRDVRRGRPGGARARGALHARPRGRRPAHRRAAGPPVEAGRHGHPARGGPAAPHPGGPPGRPRGHAAARSRRPWPRRPPTWPPSSSATRPSRSTAATATARSTRSSAPTGTSAACASAPARSRRSATTSAGPWPADDRRCRPGWVDPLAD